MMVVDYVGFILHWYLGRLICIVDQSLLQELPLGGRVDILVAQLIAEVMPVAVEIPLQRFPYMTLGDVNVPDNCFDFLLVGESMAVGNLFKLLYELFYWVVNFPEKYGASLSCIDGMAAMLCARV